MDRPSCSTSGGQSDGVSLGDDVEPAARGTVGVVIVVVGVDGEESALACLVRARQAATEVQVRQLGDVVSWWRFVT